MATTAIFAASAAAGLIGLFMVLARLLYPKHGAHSPQAPRPRLAPVREEIKPPLGEIDTEPMAPLDDSGHTPRVGWPIFIDDVADHVNDPEDWLHPLTTGGRLAERTLTNEFVAAGWVRRATKRGNR